MTQGWRGGRGGSQGLGSRRTLLSFISLQIEHESNGSSHRYTDCEPPRQGMGGCADCGAGASAHRRPCSYGLTASHALSARTCRYGSKRKEFQLPANPSPSSLTPPRSEQQHSARREVYMRKGLFL